MIDGLPQISEQPNQRYSWYPSKFMQTKHIGCWFRLYRMCCYLDYAPGSSLMLRSRCNINVSNRQFNFNLIGAVFFREGRVRIFCRPVSLEFTTRLIQIFDHFQWRDVFTCCFWCLEENILDRSGETVSTADLSRLYGFTDNGRFANCVPTFFATQ